jgi:hypothetical protein
MAIIRIDKDLLPSDKIEDLNDQTLELSGKISNAQFDEEEIEALYSGTGMSRKYVRNYSLSASTGANAWYNWVSVKDETSYSIWRFDNDINYSHSADNEFYFDDALLVNKGTATSEDITTFDTVYVYDQSADTYNDHTSEASTEGGTGFTLLETTSDYIYIGHSGTFGGIRFKFSTRGSNHTLTIQHSQGSGEWRTLLATEDSLDDETSNLRRDGSISFTSPGTWDTDAVNGVTKYWIRIKSTATPVTAAKAYCILPYDSVPGLLALSSSELTDEDWKFCHYNIPGTGSRVYMTFRNSGGSAYEGNYYVTSTSSHANKENFFRFNHSITGNYLDSRYSSTGANFTVSEIIADQVDLGASGFVTGASLYFNKYSYLKRFTNADLTGGHITFNHALGKEYPLSQIYNNSDVLTAVDSVTSSGANFLVVDLTTQGALSGDWHIRVVA